MSQRRYPRRFDGSEYYKKSTPFQVDATGRQVYARDRLGNELYPKRRDPLFARDEHNEPYYARDADGNETYPCLAGQTHVIPGKLARDRTGATRYPVDARGNEYYLLRDGRPFLLTRSNGETYFAKNCRGYSLIPWNFVQINDDTPYLCTRDAGGTVVYVHETELSPTLKSACECLCRCATHLLCPALLRVLLR